MYLAYVITTSGAAIIFGSITAFIAPVICFSVIHVVIIPFEERNLQKIFGQKYEHYQHSRAQMDMKLLAKATTPCLLYLSSKGNLHRPIFSPKSP